MAAKTITLQLEQSSTSVGPGPFDPRSLSTKFPFRQKHLHTLSPNQGVYVDEVAENSDDDEATELPGKTSKRSTKSPGEQSNASSTSFKGRFRSPGGSSTGSRPASIPAKEKETSSSRSRSNENCTSERGALRMQQEGFPTIPTLGTYKPQPHNVPASFQRPAFNLNRNVRGSSKYPPIGHGLSSSNDPSSCISSSAGSLSSATFSPYAANGIGVDVLLSLEFPDCAPNYIFLHRHGIVNFFYK